MATARAMGAPMGTPEDIRLQAEANADIIARRAGGPQVYSGFPANVAHERVVWVDPKLIASREQAARIAAHERAVNAHNVAKLKTKNEKVAFRKQILMKPLVEGPLVSSGWVEMVKSCDRVDSRYAEFTNQDWQVVAQMAREDAEATFINPPLTDIEATLIAQFCYAQTTNPSGEGALYLGEANTWVVVHDILKALGLIRENEIVDTPPQFEAAPAPVVDNEHPYSDNPSSSYAKRDREIRAEQAAKESDAAADRLQERNNPDDNFKGAPIAPSPTVVMHAQQIPIQTGVKIDTDVILEGDFKGRSVDSLSSVEYMRWMNIGTSVQRGNHIGHEYTGTKQRVG